MRRDFQRCLHVVRYSALPHILLTVLTGTTFFPGHMHVAKAAHTQALALNDYTNLIFSDEFDGDSLDTSKWNATDAAATVNGEQEYYTPSDVFENNNVLVLKSEQRDLGGRSYTSAEVTTANKFSFTYGRVDISAMFPAGQGMWPSLWMLGTGCNDSIPAQGCPGWAGPGAEEIDITDQGDYSSYQVENKDFYGAYPNVQQGAACDYPTPDLSGGYHTYSIVWSPGQLDWYFDGTQTCSTTVGVPSTDMFLILDTAVRDPDSSTVFPQFMYVDSVHVYQ